jgi:ferrous iron transport protein B
LRTDELRKQYEKVFGSVFLELEQSLQELQTDAYTSMWLAVKLLEGDKGITEEIQNTAEKDVWDNIQTILKQTDNGLLTSANCKFNWLHEIAKTTTVKCGEKESILGKFDKAATSPIIGQLMALGIIAMAMYISFKIGYALMNAVGVVYGYAMQAAYAGMAAINAPAFLTGLVCDALVTGVFYSLMMTFFVFGMTLVFGLIEETGYMARVSYVFDNSMQRLGLHGKAIMPFLLSFGCTIAGVAGTRVIDSGKQRLLAIATCWVVPCSAMWGVISLMGSTFFGANAIWVILLLFVVAFIHLKITAALFGRSLNKKEDRTGLIMELPPYHKPNYKALLREIWLRISGIFRKAVKVIVGVTVVFWLLSYTADGNITGSLIYKFGTTIEPFTMFFGLSWELFIAFLISAIGKESSLGVITTLFAQHNAMGNVYNATFLGMGLATGDLASGMLASISVPQALAFMFAFFFNVPCFMTVAATVGEIHSTKWTLRIMFYYLISALLLAGIVYRIALLFF